MTDTMQRFLTTPQNKNLIALTLTAVAATAGVWYILGMINRNLAPYTIIDLEFARTTQRLSEMTMAWGEAGNSAAALSLWVDFAFMPAYALLFAGLTLLAARAVSGAWRTLGLWLTLAPFVAWAFDALENVMLLNALPPAAPTNAGLTVAAVAAAIKFGLLLIGAVYVLAVGGLAGLRRLTGAAPAR
jgi:hypothetical protein